MKLWLYTMIILPMCVCGQNNLVPNGDFEAYLACPNNGGQIANAVPWQTPMYNGATPEYFNVCAGNNGLGIYQNTVGSQSPHSGNGYAGLFAFDQHHPSFRELIQVRLTDTLIKGVPYQVSFWASLGDRANYSISTLGAYLSDTIIDTNEFSSLSLTPQIFNDPRYDLNNKTDWMLVSDTFTSNVGGELYLNISNFHKDSLSDTIFLNAGITAGPYAYYYIDDVSVIPLDSITGINESEKVTFDLFPNPSNGSFSIRSHENLKIISVELFDVQGQKIIDRSDPERNNQFFISTESITPGMYSVKVRFDTGITSWKKVVISP